jgi:tetratricopeptide (TPR) repeat protein
MLISFFVFGFFPCCADPASQDQDPLSYQRDVLLLRGTFQGVNQDPLIALAMTMKRHPFWKMILPETIKAVQKKAEKKCSFDSAHGPLLASFFTRHLPLTVKGWMMYGKCVTHNSSQSQNFYDQLRWMWSHGEDKLTPQEQTDMVKTFKTILSPSLNKTRVEMLLCQNQLEKAKSMLSEMKLSKGHPLWIACRLKTKDAAKNDPQALQAYEKLSSNEKHDPVLVMAAVSFWARTNTPLKALDLWKKARMGEFAQRHEKFGHKGKIIQEALDKAEVSLMRNLFQEGQKREVKGDKQGARALYTQALQMRQDTFPVNWDEYVWMKGFIYYAGLKDFKSALPYFLCLANETPPSLEAPLFVRQGGQFFPRSITTKGIAPMLPAKVRARYKARGLFWAGLCYEKLGRKESAVACFEKAAVYGFYFYGQMAQFKLNRPLTMKFPSVDGQKGFQGKEYAVIFDLMRIWNSQKGAGSLESSNQTVQPLIRDLTQLAKTPSDKKRALELISKLDPIAVTFIAKSFTTDPASIFPQAYPTLPLPLPAKDPSLVYAITLAETCFNPHVVSSAGALGIMQIMPYEAPDFAKKAGVVYSPSQMSSPSYGMKLGITELEEKLKKYTDYIPTIASYNAGPKKANQWLSEIPSASSVDNGWIWIESIPYAETRAYVPRVLEHRGVYRWLSKNPTPPSQVHRLLRVGKEAPLLMGR